MSLQPGSVLLHGRAGKDLQPSFLSIHAIFRLIPKQESFMYGSVMGIRIKDDESEIIDFPRISERYISNIFQLGPYGKGMGVSVFP